MSILALTIDRLEGYRSTHGDQAANGMLSQVARAVRRLAANIGIVAASYRNGMIILVAPEFGANSARELGARPPFVDLEAKQRFRAGAPRPTCSALTQLSECGWSRNGGCWRGASI